MQFTGQAGRHLSHPEHSSGTITTSGPWLKMAPNWGGQWRRQASQLMHSDISMRTGALRHLGLRWCAAMRSSRVAAPTARSIAAGIDPRSRGRLTDGVATAAGARRHTEQGLERKEQLLDHATRLFASRGYASTRVSDICKDAGVAKGLFYWYFENKEALFAELVRSMRAQLAATRAESIDPAADPLTQLRQAVACSVRFIARHTEFFTVLRMERREPTGVGHPARGRRRRRGGRGPPGGRGQ